jgi:hypothetical protein
LLKLGPIWSSFFIFEKPGKHRGGKKRDLT